jgi:TIR domain
MSDIFISYASEDRPRAEVLAQTLVEGHGWSTFWDRTIPIGKTWRETIGRELKGARCVIVLWSKTSIESGWVQEEADDAKRRGVLVPILIEDVQPPIGFRSIQAARLENWDGTEPTQAFRRLIADIAVLIGPPPKEAEKEGRQAEPENERKAEERKRAKTEAERAEAARNAQKKVEEARLKAEAAEKAGPKYPAPKAWLLPALGGVVCVALLFGGAWLYQNRASKPMPAPSVASSESKPEPKKAEPLVPELVPFISDRDRAKIRNTYLPADDHKALAISLTQIGFISGQADDDAAKAGALDNCRQATDAGGRKDLRCDLYALGSTVVYTGGHPPLPPQPWLVPNTSVERPFDPMNVPLVRSKITLAKEYGDAAKPKALALSPVGSWSYGRGESSPEEAIRRALEWCGRHGVPCMIVAVDDRFVVAIPTTMKVTGFFQATTNALILPELRSDVARRLGNVTTGWSAVAVGTGGGPGLALGALSEQAAIDGALADCSTRDRNCRVIAIGPFLVEPQN